MQVIKLEIFNMKEKDTSVFDGTNTITLSAHLNTVEFYEKPIQTYGHRDRQNFYLKKNTN